MIENTTEQNPLKRLAMRLIFIIGIILAIALFAFALTRILPPLFTYIGNSFSSLFNRGDDSELIVSTSKQSVYSEEPFTISWNAGTTTENSSITVPCATNVSFMYVGSQNTRIPMTCGKDFKIGGISNEAILIPRLTKADSYADAEIEVKAQSATGSELNGSVIVTIASRNTTVSVATTTPATTATTTLKTVTKQNPASSYIPAPYSPSYSPTYNPPVSHGPADLAIGPVYLITNVPVPEIAFAVTNIGSSYSGNWTLKVNLPNNQVFTSGIMPSLAPGQSGEYSMSLGTVTGSGTYSVVVIVDSNNQVAESNENNNASEIKISGQGGTGSIETSGSKPDLTVRILDVNERGRDEFEVVFEVVNIGGATARDWRFEAELPTEDDETYRSGEQGDLVSGGSVQFTLRFDNARDGDFEVTVDSEDDVNESKENNNSDRVRINN